jgi:hypothetical protein
MSDLNPCRCGSPAAEHFRGEWCNDWNANHPEQIELDNPAALDDFRVACSTFPKCPLNTGWCAPTLKETARIRALWNTMNPGHSNGSNPITQLQRPAVTRE